MAELSARGFVPVCLTHNVYFDSVEQVWFKRFDVVADLLDARIMGAPVACPLCTKELKRGNQT